MLRAESTLICSLALMAPQFILHAPLQAFFQHGLWILIVQLAGTVLLAQPLIFCELSLGQRSRYGPVKCWCFGPAWKGIGLLMLVTSALDLMSLNVDLLEYFKTQQLIISQQIPLLYLQTGLWLSLLPLLILWPKFSSKLWVLGSLVCLGGIIALAARALSLNHAKASLQRLWHLSSQLPANPLDLLRTSLLPFLSTAGTGVMIALGSYRSPGANAYADSVAIVTLVFAIGSVLTLSSSSLAANHCLANSLPGSANKTVACNLDDVACPMVALDGFRNSSCDFLAYYGADAAENIIGGANLYGRLLDSLPRNDVSPVAWQWCLRCVLAWLCLTYLLVRADTWVRALADKMQGAKRMRDCKWTARFLAALITCPAMGSLAFVMHHYRHLVSVKDAYQLSTVRWLPLLLGALACLAITHGYGGVRFVKEIGGGAAMRPWFYALVGFVTPALTIAVAGLRMHVSILAVLWPNSGQAYFTNSLISERYLIPSYATLLLAVSAFLFLLVGLFTPLVWHGMCRRQRCIDLVQPTKSWHRNQQTAAQQTRSSQQQRQQQQQQQRSPHQGRGGARSRHSSDDSSANGGDIVRDLGATTIEESPMLHTMQHHHQQQQQNYPQHHQLAGSEAPASAMSWPQRPLLTGAAGAATSASPPPPPPPPPLHNDHGMRYQSGTVSKTVVDQPIQQQQQQQQQRMTAFNPTYSTATLPGNSGGGGVGSGGGGGGVIRFNLNEDNPTVTKTLNRGILKNKHDSFRQQQQQQMLPMSNHGGYSSGGENRQHRGSTEIL